jgi:hypothetical protein
MSVLGLPRENALQIGLAVESLIHQFGKTIDLSTLDGVTIGLDYRAALSRIDRGLPDLPSPEPTDTEELRGVAMAVDVYRDGEYRTHLVFDAEAVKALIYEENGVTIDDWLCAIGTVAHECAHVQIAAEKRRAIPGGVERQVSGYEQETMLAIAEHWWDEYAVCRLSAPLACAQAQRFATSVVASAAVARRNADAAIEEYSIDDDLDKFIANAGGALSSPLTAAAYLTGALDGIGSSWDCHREASQALAAAELTELVGRLHTELRRLWDSYDSWPPSLDTFSGLEQIAKQVFASHGILFDTAHDGACCVTVSRRKKCSELTGRISPPVSVT